MAAAAFPVTIHQLQDLLPGRLSPLHLLPRKDGTVLFSSKYQDVVHLMCTTRSVL